VILETQWNLEQIFVESKLEMASQFLIYVSQTVKKLQPFFEGEYVLHWMVEFY